MCAIGKSVCTSDVIGKAPRGAILIDCSTIDVATAREVISLAGLAGYDMVDAPVSGGIAAANAGTLTFMVGGTESAFKRAEPILSAMGKAVIHDGDAGNGQAAKICRSEENTSELQSLMRISYAVLCLKKNIKNPSSSTHHR